MRRPGIQDVLQNSPLTPLWGVLTISPPLAWASIPLRISNQSTGCENLWTFLRRTPHAKPACSHAVLPLPLPTCNLSSGDGDCPAIGSGCNTAPPDQLYPAHQYQRLRWRWRQLLSHLRSLG